MQKLREGYRGGKEVTQLYDFEDEKVRRFLKQREVKRAAVQVPAGLKQYLSKITPAFEDVGVEVLVLAGSCYGACDLADAKARQLGCDVLIHYGHADIGLPTCLPTLYVEARMKVDPSDVIKQALPEVKFRRLGLVTTVQHIGYLTKVAELLRAGGIDVVIGKPGFMAKYPGQVLGCDLGCARSIAGRVDGFLYIGTGEFHPLGVALATGKRVLAINPVSGGLKALAPDVGIFLRRRKAMIARAAAGERFGVVVSTKPGQARFKLAMKLAGELKRAGKVAHVLVVDEVGPEELGDFGLDGFICAACPRIPLDDAERFEQPILTPFEARVMLGKTKFEPYQMGGAIKEDF